LRDIDFIQHLRLERGGFCPKYLPNLYVLFSDTLKKEIVHLKAKKIDQNIKRISSAGAVHDVLNPRNMGIKPTRLDEIFFCPQR